MRIYSEYIRKAQNQVADQTEKLNTLFNGTDGFLRTLRCSAQRQTSIEPGGYILRINYYLSRLSAAREELSGALELLKAAGACRDASSIQLSMIQAEQMVLAIDSEAAVLRKCRDDLVIFMQAQRQSADTADVNALKDFRNALRRYEDEKEKNT